VARILILGGGCRGLQLAGAMIDEGHAVRISTRTEAGRAAIERSGAECWLGTPDRLATLRGALDSVTIACWLLGSAQDSPARLRALYSTRLALFLTQAIDTTVRGLVYEANGTVAPGVLLSDGARMVKAHCQLNAIPAEFLSADPRQPAVWLSEACGAVRSLLSRG
jgi:hypothetical protein